MAFIGVALNGVQLLKSYDSYRNCKFMNQEIKVVVIPNGNTINDIKMKGDANCMKFDQTQLRANKVGEELLLTFEEVEK